MKGYRISTTNNSIETVFINANGLRFDVDVCGSGDRFASWRDAPTLETPTRLIWGEQDSSLGKELTYGTQELVPDLTLRYLPDVSHWVQQEAPETVNAIIEAWLLGRAVPEADAR